MNKGSICCKTERGYLYIYEAAPFNCIEVKYIN